MSLNELAIIGGIWLSLIYAATVTPASVWVIQLTVSRSWWSGLMAALGMAMGQVPWSLAAGIVLFQFAEIWQRADLALRILSASLFIFLSIRSMRAKPISGLRLEVQGSGFGIFRMSFWRSLVMPWRFPLWLGLIISMSVHLRGPGGELALPFSLGAVAGQLAWYVHFILIAALFGNKVPDNISLHSMNKLRLLATLVLAGTGLLTLAPLAIPFS
jgi:threonine/homoserine/homoserine lactone efflux protein